MVAEPVRMPSLSAWVSERVRAHVPVVSLRDYQDEAVDHVAHAVSIDGKRRVMVVLPTGSGKTVVFGALANAFLADGMGRVLVLAHRDELIQQAAAKLSLWLPRHLIGIVKAGRNECDAPCVVASVQTLKNENRLAQVGSFGLIVVDEAHHASAASYKKILGELGGFTDHGPIIVGVTATPKRGDGVRLDDVFEDVVYARTYSEMVAARYLAPVESKVFDLIEHAGRPRLGIDGDYSEGWLEGVMLRANAPDKIVEAWKAEAYDRPTIVFTPTVSVAKAVAEAFNAAGVSAAWVSGAMPVKDRRDVLSGLAAGRIRVVANCAVLTEGFDEPSVSCIVVGRPTMNETLYIQMVGRGTRLHPESGKQSCISEGQRVLTDHGLIPIENVTRAMKVWDGIGFVSHCGVILRGYQEVISYAGLTATPDHRVWTDEGWKSFGECASDGTQIRVTGNGRNALRETDRYRRGARDEGATADAHGPMCDMRDRGATTARQSTSRSGRLRAVCAATSRPQVVTTSGHVSKAAMHESQRQSLRQIRRSGDRIPILIDRRNGSLGAGESRLAQRDGDRPYRQQRPLRGEQPSVCDTVAEYRQFTRGQSERSIPCVQVEVSRGDLCGHHPENILLSGHDSDADRGEILPAVQKTKRRVWDILNAGPRHRFTVEGLLVSNCLILDMVGCADQLQLDAVVELGGRRAVAGRSEGEPGAGKGDGDVPFSTVDGALVGRTVKAVRPVCRWANLGEGWHALSLMMEGWVTVEPDEDGTWKVVHRPKRGKLSVEFTGLDLDWAKSAGEGVARKEGTFGAMTRRAGWLDRPLSEKAYAYGLSAGFPMTNETTAWQFTTMQAERMVTRWRR